MMDMKPNQGHGINGKIKVDFLQQIDVMKDVRNAYPQNILPFVAIDPRRPDEYEKVFLKPFSPGYNFFGIKIYPSLGYLPSDPLLMKIFEICEEKNIPVIAHCGTARVRSSYHRMKDIKGLREVESGKYESFTENKCIFRKRTYAIYFNHPQNWEPVLHSFPKLRLNLAHFGGGDEWEKLAKGNNNTWVSKIMDLMWRYENLYADISFNISNHSIYEILRRRLEDNGLLLERTLYGSDFYMVTTKGHFRSIKMDFVTAMGDRIINQIARINPKNFLGLEEGRKS